MRARLVPAVLAACVAVAGCSGDEPDAGPTLPPLTGSPSVSPSAVAVPPEATAATPEGAAEFAKFFASEVHQAYVTGDAGRIERLSAPGCQACQSYIESIEQIKASGATIADSYTVEVLDAQAPGEVASATTTRVTVLLRIGEFVLTGPDGAEVLREAAAERAVQEISLERTPNGWRTTEVTRD